MAVEPEHAPMDCVQIKDISVSKVFDVKVVEASVLEAYDPTPECVQVPEPSCASVDTEIVMSPHVVSSIMVTGDVISGAEVSVPERDKISVSADVALTVILPERFPEAPLVIRV